MHDAVILYSLAVNETLSEGGDILDGFNMTRKMWNRTFVGKTLRFQKALKIVK